MTVQYIRTADNIVVLGRNDSIADQGTFDDLKAEFGYVNRPCWKSWLKWMMIPNKHHRSP